MSRIRLEDVAKEYGSFTAVRDFSLDIAEGELVALLGPSGCGKTTTLRIVAGFVDATRGRVLLGDRNVTGLPPYRRNTGMVFQGYALFPHLTVAQNVAFGLEMRKLGAAETKARVREALSLVRLEGLAERLPKQLSGGQQQRVALARALVIKPDVLLLDEPLSNLDAKLRHEVRVEIRQLQQALGLTTIFVTHDQEEALTVADRLVVMNHGRIEQIGSPDDLYEKPRTRFVAEFIGKSNFFAGSVVDRGVFRTKTGETLRFTLTDTPPRVPLLAVRPEKITIATGSDPALPNTLGGRIDLATYLGPVSEYGVRLPSGMLVLVHHQNREGIDTAFKVGSTVVLQWRADASLLLDGEDASA